MPLKKIFAISAIVGIVLLVILFLNNSPSYITVLANGVPIEFDVQPQSVNGRIIVPLRTVGEAIGAKVEWVEDSKTMWMYLDGRYIGLTAGSDTMRFGTLNGTEMSTELEVTPELVDGRLMVPVFAISEGLHSEIQWDAENDTVKITSHHTERPVIDSKEKFLAAIEENINNLTTQFSLETVGLASLKQDFDITEYFFNVQEARVSWVNYFAAGNEHTFIEYDLTFSMYFNISHAIMTDETGFLTPRELQVYRRVMQIVADNIREDMSEFEKQLVLHDYLVYNTRYDTSPLGEIPIESHTPYGALIRGIAVCNGYSYAFKLLMDAVGIYCTIVYGEAEANGVIEKHAWNRVNIGGNYYLVDTTWASPFPDMPGVITYDYFNVTDEMISISHTPFTVDENKRSVSERHNYFVYHDLIVNSQECIDNIIRLSLENNASTIFMRGDEFDISDISLFEQAFARYAEPGLSIRFSHNDRMNIMRIFL